MFIQWKGDMLLEEIKAGGIDFRCILGLVGSRP